MQGWESAIFGPIVFSVTIDAIAGSRFIARLKYLEAQRRLAYLSCMMLGLTLICALYWFRAYEYQFAPYYAAQIYADCYFVNIRWVHAQRGH